MLRLSAASGLAMTMMEAELFPPAGGYNLKCTSSQGCR